ncbi:MAG: mechanosensitive ion channel family protein [Xanthomonadales bacterium]|nr:mechanosensitive ion channel family protein [Xanthomonadales bacterium]
MLETWSQWQADNPMLATLTGLLLLLLAAVLADLFARRALVRAFVTIARRTRFEFDDHLVEHKVPARLAHIVPAAVIQFGIVLVPGLAETAITVVRNVAFSVTVLMVMLALGGLLRAINAAYEQRHRARQGSIKGYTQLLSLAVYILGSIVIVATLIDRSPMILLSGMGAMAAVLMLVFQDTLLSLVASVQINSQDMVRVGDWIEMPQLNADGDVIDIALHTVKVRNWDKTITTLPTRRLISDPFKNWRGMTESGGRRIKRTLDLDLQSIGFMDAQQIDGLKEFTLLRGYLADKQRELDEYNAGLGQDGQLPINARRLTNIGTFRAYVDAYLRAHPGINQEMTTMVRQLQPGATGLPLELYCFTADVRWVVYEGVQADIFDHLIAILPRFGLRLFQNTSGHDLRQAVALLGQRQDAGPPSLPSP